MSPFILKGENRHAVLLLHAFASNCVDHNLVAKALNRAGYTVKAINFTGHGTGNIGDVLDATPGNGLLMPRQLSKNYVRWIMWMASLCLVCRSEV